MGLYICPGNSVLLFMRVCGIGENLSCITNLSLSSSGHE